MPLYHCTKCHHEWEASKLQKNFVCDWCHSPGKIIQKETPFEKFIEEWSLGRLDGMLHRIQKGIPRK